jgi:hypothetical protein
MSGRLHAWILGFAPWILRRVPRFFAAAASARLGGAARRGAFLGAPHRWLLTLCALRLGEPHHQRRDL